jgi:hypothetical protein
VDLSWLGFGAACLPPAVAGSLRVSGAVTFDGATFWDESLTLSLVTVARTGTVAGPIRFVKQ